MAQNSSATTPTTEYWDSEENDIAMQEGHAPSWAAMIADMREADLKNKTILDFGCNRGGFFHALYRAKPFKRGIGVDLARQALDYAAQTTGALPLTYGTPDILGDYRNTIDMAFSHEVMYLIEDLNAHAAQMAELLTTGGVYYAVLGEYAENPLWARWIKQIPEFSVLKPQNHSLNDIWKAFDANGFDVALKPLRCDGFIPYRPSKYFSDPLEMMDFMLNKMMFFRFAKRTD